MLPLVGSALGSAAIVVLALVRSDTPNRGWLLAGAAAGLLTFVITAVYHVPHNDAFARLDPAASAAATRPGGTTSAAGRGGTTPGRRLR